jgi:hypothetical protein
VHKSGAAGAGIQPVQGRGPAPCHDPMVSQVWTVSAILVSGHAQIPGKHVNQALSASRSNVAYSEIGQIGDLGSLVLRPGHLPAGTMVSRGYRSGIFTPRPPGGRAQKERVAGCGASSVMIGGRSAEMRGTSPIANRQHRDDSLSRRPGEASCVRPTAERIPPRAIGKSAGLSRRPRAGIAHIPDLGQSGIDVGLALFRTARGG